MNNILKRMNKIWYGANWHKPQYMLRLSRNILLRYFFNQRPLRGIDFAVTYSCNLKCKHCFNNDLVSDRKLMSLDDYARVFKDAEREGILNFCFQGGEFLLLPCWEEYIALLDAKKFSVSVTTNGVYLNRSIAQRLKHLGVNTVTISLDSGIAKEHDLFRGEDGIFSKAISAIDYSLLAGLKVVVNVTITPQSLDSEGFKKLIELSKKKKVLLNTIFGAPSGKWTGCKEIIMRPSDIKKYKVLCQGHNNIVRDMDSLYWGYGCPGVNESLYITPYGDVFGCAYIHILLGNVFQESLHEIRKKGFKYFNYSKECLIAEKEAFIYEYSELIKGKRLPLSYEAHEDIKSW